MAAAGTCQLQGNTDHQGRSSLTLNPGNPGIPCRPGSPWSPFFPSSPLTPGKPLGPGSPGRPPRTWPHWQSPASPVVIRTGMCMLSWAWNSPGWGQGVGGQVRGSGGKTRQPGQKCWDQRHAWPRLASECLLFCVYVVRSWLDSHPDVRCFL